MNKKAMISICPHISDIYTVVYVTYLNMNDIFMKTRGRTLQLRLIFFFWAYVLPACSTFSIR